MFGRAKRRVASRKRGPYTDRNPPDLQRCHVRRGHSRRLGPLSCAVKGATYGTGVPRELAPVSVLTKAEVGVLSLSGPTVPDIFEGSHRPPYTSASLHRNGALRG